MEPQFIDDPGSVATLTVVRSPGGSGIVHLLWRLEDMARDDLKPLNGTLQFNEACHSLVTTYSLVCLPVQNLKAMFLQLRGNVFSLIKVFSTLGSFQTESKKMLVISALADAVLEGDERFMVHLLAPKNEGVIDTIKGQCLVVGNFRSVRNVQY